MERTGNGGKPRTIRGRLARLLRDPRGNIAPIIAIVFVPLAAALAMGSEVANWYMVQHAAQNAADSAVIAAATEDLEQGGDGKSDYATVADSVASNYGFTDGTSNATISVTLAKNASVPACKSSACYSVQVTKVLPLYLTPIVGYTGNTAVGNKGGRGVSVTAVALAQGVNVQAPFCLLVLGNGGVTAHGIPNAQLTCNMFSNGQADCTGHTLTTGFSDNAGNNNKNTCGNAQLSGQNPASDPYAADAKNVPSNKCKSFFPDTNASWPVGNGISNNMSSSPAPFCGDVKLTGNVTITNPDTLIVIVNGTLDLNGFTIQTASGASATIVFTGPGPKASTNVYTSGGTPNNFVTGNGTLDVAAPTSGNWDGMAVFQDASVLNQTSVTYTGNNPTFDVSGIMDISQVDLTAKGAINKSSNGNSCFSLIVDSLLIDGTGDLFNFPSGPLSQCPQSNVTPPQEFVQIGQLVF